MLRRVDHETLDVVFQEWIIQLQKYINPNGEYVEWFSNWNVQFLFLNGRSWDVTLRRKILYWCEWESAIQIERQTMDWRRFHYDGTIDLLNYQEIRFPIFIIETRRKCIC
jgi:hypothetical protein